VVNAKALGGNTFPRPPGFPEWDTGSLLVTQAHSAMLFVAPVIMISLFVFLRRSRFGMAIRAAAANPDAASMAGMSPTTMATMTWALAGGIAAFTAALVLPTRGLLIGEAFGLSLLLPALTAAVLGRMQNLGVAMLGGIGAGMIERVISFNTGSDGAVAAILFVIILVALLFQSRQGTREKEKGSWLAAQAWTALPERVAELKAVRGTPWVLGVLAIAVAVVVNLNSSNEIAFILVSSMALAIVGLSIGLLTGLAGQLSLGSFAVAGFGAFASWYFSSNSGSFPLGLIAGMCFGAIVSVAVGLPALRLRGLLLAITTLGFALASQSYFLQQDAIFGGGRDPGRPIFLGEDLNLAKEYFWVALVVLVIAMLFTRNLRNGAFGRRLVGLRDNEDNARAFAIQGNATTLTAYAVAGAIAGLGGALYGHLLPQLTPTFFLANVSIDIVVMTVVGGISLLSGPVLGAFWIIAVPRLVGFDLAGQAVHGLLTLVVVLFSPGGISGLLRPARESWVRLIARRAGIDLDANMQIAGVQSTDALPSGARSAARVQVGPRRPSTGSERTWVKTPLLTVEHVSKSYGGVTAVSDVSIQILEGETVGLVGPNGAGKTTLFELISGFVRSDSGTITFLGEDITHMGPESRAQLGLIRSFQDATLFPTMTLLDAVMLAQERVNPSRLHESLFGMRERDRSKDVHARDLIGLMGLDMFRDRQIGQLSTGTRRIAELTCALALQPRLLLLDEPAAGVAQKETEALGQVLEGVKKQLNTTLVIIEHDIPLLASMSDWMVAMESGSLLIEGEPADVQADPRVVEAFLGGDASAISRSNLEPAAPVA
jgi:ABC-type branched-subunit amino acid transport system ATPase component/ABC-type branched-subunit amino acid transport system permease subunit